MNGNKRNAFGVISLFLNLACHCLVTGADATYQGKPASYWLDEFYSPTNDSVAAFKAMGSNAVPFLIKVLETKPSKLGELADEARAKYSIGREIPSIIEKSLPSAYRVETRREHAAFLIGQIGPEADAAIPVLLRVFTDQTESWRVIGEARSALLSMGEKAAVLIPTYLSWLKSTNVEVQIEGVIFLGSVGLKGRIAVPELLEAANGTNSRIRWAAANALWRVDRQTNVALRVFTTGLQSTNDTTRQLAFYHLRQMGKAAHAAGPEIMTTLQDPDPAIRREAEMALREIDPQLLASNSQAINNQATNIVEKLAQTIQSGEFKDRLNALEALPVFGPAAKLAVPALIEALNAPPPNLPGNFSSIGQMNSRRAAAIALGEIGPDARAAVPVLIELIKNPRGGFAAVYCKALGQIGPDAKDAVTVLETALHHDDHGVRLAAADALTRVVPQSASNAVAVLKTLQHDPELAKVWVADNSGGARLTGQLDFNNPSSRYFRLCTSVSLWRLGLEKEPPVAALIDELGKNNHPDRTIIEFLGEIGPEARSALPALRKFLAPETYVGNRRAAAIAIRKIDQAEAERLGLPGMLALP